MGHLDVDIRTLILYNILLKLRESLEITTVQFLRLSQQTHEVDTLEDIHTIELELYHTTH